MIISQRAGETLLIGDSVRLQILKTTGRKVVFRIEIPDDVVLLRMSRTGHVGGNREKLQQVLAEESVVG